MRVALAEVGVPGVQVGIEVHQPNRARPLAHRPKQSQGDGVVAAQRHHASAGGEDIGRARLDLGQGGHESNGVQAMSPASTTC